MLMPTELKNGTVFKIDGQTYIVLKYEHVTQGRGGATIKVKLKNLKTFGVTEKGFNANEKLEDASVEKSTFTFLYSDDANSFFMDIKTYDQVSVRLTDSALFLKNGEKVIMVKVDGEFVYYELPKTVELKVTYAESGFKGNTITNPTKKVTLETGLQILAPMFVNTGDVVKVNTSNSEYLSRV